MTEKEVKVSERHVWVGIEDQHARLGLTNFIQDALGTVISVELPDIGDRIEEGEVFAEIESVSTVYELIAPITGTVLSVNPHLEDHPAIINEEGQGGNAPLPAGIRRAGEPWPATSTCPYTTRRWTWRLPQVHPG